MMLESNGHNGREKRSYYWMIPVCGPEYAQRFAGVFHILTDAFVQKSAHEPLDGISDEN
jgi:hypothetical protein